jgi:hypothetical protein
MSDKKPIIPPCGEGISNGTRRDFIKQSSVLTAVALTPGTVVHAASDHMDEQIAAVFEKMPLKMEVNGKPHNLAGRTTLHPAGYPYANSSTLPAPKKAATTANAVPAPCMWMGTG